MSLHGIKSKYLTKPFVVKTAGGAASQSLGLMSAIYISLMIKRPFVIKHYPFSTGGYFPLAIGPLLSKDEYSSGSIAGIAKGYFEGSYREVVSFLVDKKKLSVEDLEVLLKQLKKKK